MLSFAAHRTIPSLCESTLGEGDTDDDDEYSHCYYGWICLCEVDKQVIVVWTKKKREDGGAVEVWAAGRK